MPEQVLDLEAAVTHARQQQSAGATFEAGLLVNEFVCRIDGHDPADEPNRDHPSQGAHPREWRYPNHPSTKQQHRCVERQAQQRQPAVVTIFGKRRLVTRGGIRSIPTDQCIEQRNEHEVPDGNDERRGIPGAAARGDGVAGKGQRHRQQEEQVACFVHGAACLMVQGARFQRWVRPSSAIPR